MRDEDTCPEEVRKKYPTTYEVYMEAGCQKFLPDCDEYSEKVCDHNSDQAFYLDYCRGATKERWVQMVQEQIDDDKLA